MDVYFSVTLPHDSEKAVPVVTETEKQVESDVKEASSSSSQDSEHVVSLIVPPLLGEVHPSIPSASSQDYPIPARDTSWAAWRVLCGTILVQGVLFAFPLTFGVFQDFFGTHAGFSNNRQSIWIGVLSIGVPFMGAPFMTILCEKYPQLKWRYYVILGWTLCFASLIGAAFAKTLVGLAWTQGVMYGTGLLIMDTPALLILNTWFIKRRGTAYGLLFGMTDFIGFGATILTEWLLRKHTLRGALLTFGCSLFIICGPAIFLLRIRPTTLPSSTPETETKPEATTTNPQERRRSSDIPAPPSIRYYRRPIFYIFALANLFHSLAYYLPFLYLPSYVTSLGYTPTRGAYLLAAANFAQIFGEMGFGLLSDRVNVHCLVLICTLASSIVTLSLWGLARSIVMLTWFALIFSTFGSGLIALWPRMGTFFGHEDAQMIFSVMSFGRGLGSIVSGPISSALLTACDGRISPVDGGTDRYGNGPYLGIVLFVGASMSVSAMMAIAGLVVGWQQNELDGISRKRRKSEQEAKV